MASARRVLLEGRPGAGKTTAVRRLAGLLRSAGVALAGFTTEELRVAGQRVGFAVEDISGTRAVLAHVDLPGSPSIGRYGLDLAAFERIAVPALAGRGDVLVLDELGPMELASPSFCAAAERLFDTDRIVVATVQLRAHPFTTALTARPDIEVITVSGRNRDRLPGDLAADLLHRIEAGSPTRRGPRR
jgi:nucleoside-triphosphatase